MQLTQNKHTIEVSDEHKTMIFNIRSYAFLGWFDVLTETIHVVPGLTNELKKCLEYKYNRITQVTETKPWIAD